MAVIDDELIKKVLDLMPCVDALCDKHGTTADGSLHDLQPAQCQFCYEARFPAAEDIAALLTNQRNQLLDELLGEMPQDRPQATKQDELIPFDGDKKVEMHWLRKCQDAGFNQCRSQVIEIINAKKSKEME